MKQVINMNFMSEAVSFGYKLGRVNVSMAHLNFVVWRLYKPTALAGMI